MNGNRSVSEEKLISIVIKGGRGKFILLTSLFSTGAFIVQMIVPFVLLTDDVKQKLTHKPSYWLLLVISLVLIFIAMVVSLFRNRVKVSLDPIKEFLGNVCKLFNSAIMPSGEARAAIYVWNEDATQKINSTTTSGYFCRLCGTMNETGPRMRANGELKCFEAYEQDRAIIVNLSEEEKRKSGRRDIKAIFAVPIDNRKGEKIGVLTIDTREEYEKCYAFSIGIDKEMVIENIKEALQGISDNLMKYMLESN